MCRTKPTVQTVVGRVLNSSAKLQRFSKYLAELEAEGFFKGEKSQGQIVYADDQFINQELLRMQFRQMGIAERLTIFS